MDCHLNQKDKNTIWLHLEAARSTILIPENSKQYYISQHIPSTIVKCLRGDFSFGIGQFKMSICRDDLHWFFCDLEEKTESKFLGGLKIQIFQYLGHGHLLTWISSDKGCRLSLDPLQFVYLLLGGCVPVDCSIFQKGSHMGYVGLVKM